MNWIPVGSILGDLAMGETLVFYDGPRVFTCTSLTDQLYLSAWAEESESGDTWLYAPISRARYAMVRSGGLALRAAFVRPEGLVYSVSIQRDDDGAAEVVVAPISATSIPDDWLPGEDFTLDIPTSTLPAATSLEDVERRARQESRAHLRLEVELPAYTRSEAPTRKIGELLVSTQVIFDNIGLAILEEEPAQRGRIPNRVAAETASDLVGLSAASFVIEVASNKLDDLLGDSVFADVTKQLFKLLQIGPEREQLLDELSTLRPRGAKSFRSFVTSLSSTNGDITIAAAGANLPLLSEKLPADRLDAMVIVLNNIVLDEASEIRGRMRLYAADLTRKNFGLLDEGDDVSYEGKISDRALAQVNHVPLNDRYDIVISEFPMFDEAVGERKPRYVLEQLVAIEEGVDEPIQTRRTIAELDD